MTSTDPDELEPGQEALFHYEPIFEDDPTDEGAANMIGRSFEALGRIDEARAHWALVVQLQPANAIAAKRLANLKHLPLKPVKSHASGEFVHRPPQEIVEPAIAGPGRIPYLRFVAQTIRFVAQLDPERLAVTDLPSDDRFRVSGGRASATTPWNGLFCVFVHAPAISAEAHEVLDASGATVVNKKGELKSLPESMQFGVPPDKFAGVAELLLTPHREHLKASIEAGQSPIVHRHDPALMQYILDQADESEASSA